MEKSECYGCKTHFEEGAKLPLQGICIELKNYPIPIKDQSHKFKLLRTICSFLNSKGGTIFIGAVDDSGEIKGVSIQRKEQDDFRIFIQQLTERIQPKVDLSDRQDILVQFVPVFNTGKFTGKHLIKILIKQGDPSQLYCFSKRIQLESTKEKKVDEYQVVYSYVRLNSGNIKELKGYDLVKEAKAKAAKPYLIFKCFHDECNPQPLSVSLEILKIGFSNLPESGIRQILQQWVEAELTTLGITGELISCDHENEMVVVEFNTKGEFTKAEEYVNKHIQELNQNLQGICCFQRKDKFLDCLLYENILKNQLAPKQKPEKKEKKRFIKKQKVQGPEKNMKEEQTKQEDEDFENEEQTQPKKKWVKVGKAETKAEKPNVPPAKSDGQERTNKKIEAVKKQEEMAAKKQKEQPKAVQVTSPQKEGNKNNIGKAWSFAFTHINPKLKNELKNALDSLMKCKKNFECYENTIEVFLPSEDLYEEFYYNVMQNMLELSSFGFKNEIRFGVNTGIIDILNFQKTKGKEFLAYLKSQMGKELRRSEIVRNGNRHTVRLLMSQPAACQWLDKFLVDKQLKNYKIPGSEKGQQPKMKIYLVCADPSEGQIEIMI